jgi:hypothetical protein
MSPRSLGIIVRFVEVHHIKEDMMFYIAIHQSEDVTSGPPPDHSDPVCLIVWLEDADAEPAEEGMATANAQLADDEEYNHYLYLEPVTQPMPVSEADRVNFPGLDDLIRWLGEVCITDDFDDDFDDDFEEEDDDVDEY